MIAFLRVWIRRVAMPEIDGLDAGRQVLSRCRTSRSRTRLVVRFEQDLGARSPRHR